ncbi:hypothetical protein SAMN04487944_1112 [Gracilibacillus ureilyticus]|uniref:Uncharacterized protein n=1 Tax=Gracilibacillus ureilyticus TaxID=531814 RepID=A0A1H9SEK9_9BACI|nr:hypothetical protein [Gracilibacillus ureilyticus]SER83424.1 hypothetical protein SAMN04487944_1112 [Gracilibacillus ureilyticus]
MTSFSRNRILFIVSIISMFLLAACTNAEGSNNSTKEAENSDDKTTESEQETEEESGKVEKNEETNADLGDHHVVLGGEITRQDGKFIIEGKSNLLPGSRLVGELLLENEEEDEAFSNTTELVQDDGSFYMELEDHQFGTAQFVISFSFHEVQDDNIFEHYGENGENLEGPYIYQYQDGGEMYQQAKVIAEYDDEFSTLTLSEPDWNEIPADMGDQRVWIEVDDIREDGEYYYLSGRSNLLEGSYITGEYIYNDDSTRVLPDGSFHLKIPYKYAEGESFIIEFRPGSMSQWKPIEEHYGSNGEKLIGNLVEIPSMSSSQIIRKEIPWEKE